MGAKKKVVQISIQGEVIKVWNSIKSACDNLGLKDSHIIRCAKGEGGDFTAGSFMWAYLANLVGSMEDYDSEELKLAAENYCKSVTERIEEYKQSTGYKVLKIDFQGNLIKMYNSTKEVSREEKISNGSLGSCLNEVKSHLTLKGHYWVYLKRVVKDVNNYTSSELQDGIDLYVKKKKDLQKLMTIEEIKEVIIDIIRTEDVGDINALKELCRRELGRIAIAEGKKKHALTKQERSKDDNNESSTYMVESFEKYNKIIDSVGINDEIIFRYDGEMIHEVWKEAVVSDTGTIAIDYYVSNMGRTKKKIGENKYKKIGYGSKKYKAIKYKGNDLKVHKIVMYTFGKASDSKEACFINHLDDKFKCNFIKSLEWITPRGNMEYSENLGTMRKGKTEVCGTRVAMLSNKDGSVMERFKSQIEAEEKYGLSKGAVRNCCAGKVRFVRGKEDTKGRFRYFDGGEVELLEEKPLRIKVIEARDKNADTTTIHEVCKECDIKFGFREGTVSHGLCLSKVGYFEKDNIIFTRKEIIPEELKPLK